MFKCSNNMLPDVIVTYTLKIIKLIPISQETVISSEFLKYTPNFTTISARLWNEIVTKIIMDQHMYPFQNLKLC